MTQGSYLAVIFFLAIFLGLLGGVLKLKHRSPLSRVPTSKEEIEKMEFEKYYELSNAQLTDIGELMDLAKRISVIETYLGIQGGDLTGVKHPVIEKSHQDVEEVKQENQQENESELEINAMYRSQLKKILELEEQGLGEEEIYSRVRLTKGEVELLKGLLDV